MVEDALEDIVVPSVPSEPVSEETIDALSEVANSAGGLADALVADIANVDPAVALDALDTLGNVLEISGAIAANTAFNANEHGAASAAASGARVLEGFASIVAALDTKANAEAAPATLTETQKTALSSATNKLLTAASNLVPAAGSTNSPSIVSSLSATLTSLTNLNVALTNQQTTNLLELIDKIPITRNDVESQLANSVALKPANKALISEAQLGQQLSGQGLAAEEIQRLRAELSQSFNPAQFAFNGNTADALFEDGLKSSFAAELVDSGQAALGITRLRINLNSLSPAAATVTDPHRLMSAVTASGELEIPLRFISASVVPSTFPTGLSMTADGMAVVTSARLASTVVPAPYDPLALKADFRSTGLVSITERGNVRVQLSNLLFSGTFDYNGISPGVPVSTTTVTSPTGSPASPAHVYALTYRDGTRQTLQPLVADDNFIASLRSRGLSVQTDRTTGVVTVEGMRFRPSFYVTPLDVQTRAFLAANKDAKGLAYRGIGDANGDGVSDIEVISELGVQVAYRF